MGKSLPNNKTRLYQLTKTASQLLNKTQTKPTPSTPQTRRVLGAEIRHNNINSKCKNMESTSEPNINNGNENTRVPLSEVVSDCVKRWFKDTLKEAKAGDINMQVLVGQMYYSGYGVARDTQKGRVWMTRASRTRASVWRVSDKHPGYNASDSDSDELKGES
ncbi:uncharacterized protein LOC116143404 [Pistacia vera]|uniref:Uncharacterized protein n=1 Tax=Pistacia integerrima TaxID=434235 RepID=A0ACC0Y3J7_9ROSI|nr:uncharacterized protein LOC116143404 [Pistacia vera]KAJ0027739.1 hypothetical protein Pint_34983 [Pistacia integerrima]